ncbi:MAG: hypothetical protein MPEBLZ_03419 [Candidatus Methanoperedens nitroreducens]|uniref:Uncharacterized protein n=1 Tax=Candidatus Methanoperedens nitratireducens TaxID=1392998 RepID=A0A0P7ZBS4_9EURY|nr:hypothetical protein [Candidatus Methanoperedens sp. BLZ2]KAB2940761.1 MAG: hypothetical protein F9K14_19070 [Candidatus Methanoperedens sp.]KPQ42032.1 MAG: hypothetical protein MPEBLZ_03419 [Candidatus Methanoperedens sp. BLZ1]MBZ0176253.1 hypothetical protein [Candidatus Methanoperedens nitroreducens]CAG0982193.1 hypothetical protein METP2_02044 [Methanosarcinales archaeon]MCX9077272.1 hypothetical protein [Candidatus Methanoperedens sp.]
MRKNKSEIYLAIFIIAVIAITSLLYVQTQLKNPYGIFPEKLGDMSISLYRDGDEAMTEVKNLHRGADVEIENAYIANYRSAFSSKAKFWVSESKNSEEAASLLEAMNSRVGKTGMFSESTPLTIERLKVYFVTGQPELGLYHYFYARDREVFWIQVDNPDESYRLNFVREAIKRV